MNSRLRTLLAAATLLAATATTAAAADPEWIRQFGTSSWDYAQGVAVGPDGRVHVAGSTEGFFADVDKPLNDVTVITFDRDGTELWRRQKGSTGSEAATAVATDSDGNVYVVGTTDGALGGAYKGGYDAFVIKLDRDGRHVWSRQPGTTSSDSARGVATDADGNVYVVGTTGGTLGGANKGAGDSFVIKFDRDGRYVWKRQPGTTGYEAALGVATDADGNVYVMGVTEGALGGTNKGGYDAFVIKFDRDGRYLWKRQPGTTETDNPLGVATDADGNVYLVGNAYGALGGTQKGEGDAFVIKFDRDGRILWTDQTGTSVDDAATSVATDADGSVYVVGYANYWDNFVFKYDRDGRILWTDNPAGTNRGDYFFDVATDADGNLYVTGETYDALPGNTNLGSMDSFVIKYGPNGPQ